MAGEGRNESPTPNFGFPTAAGLIGEIAKGSDCTQRSAGALSPNADHWSGHAIGRSIWRLTPKPRGSRPSIAALTPRPLSFRTGRAQVSERGVETTSVVDLIDEAGKIGCDVLEGFVGLGWTASTFNVFMKLSASALSSGFPRRPLEPTARLDSSPRPEVKPLWYCASVAAQDARLARDYGDVGSIGSGPDALIGIPRIANAIGNAAAQSSAMNQKARGPNAP